MVDTSGAVALSRRRLLGTLGLLGAFSALPRSVRALETSAEQAITLIGASWRGAQPDTPHFAGVLAADWQRKTLKIRYAVRLPTRPHGLLPETDGGLLVTSVRPGDWMLRCDGDGAVTARLDAAAESTDIRLSGHAECTVSSDVIFTTETNYRTGRGRIGVRDRLSLRKLDEWDAHGVEPHQALLGADGHIYVANGGVRRTLADKKVELERMESSLVRLDGRTGQLLRQWKLDDPRLSLRHLAWSQPASGSTPLLGIAMQAEHDDVARRAAAPILAVLDGDELSIPTPSNDGHGYSGDIAPALSGGFALSSNKAGRALVWRPDAPDQLAPFVKLQEAYALAGWNGPAPGGGVLVATAPGLVRWHPGAAPIFLAWPEPMALDNHWVLMNNA